MQKRREYSLDSLRGLASIQVFLGHYLVALPQTGWLIYDDNLHSHNFWFYLLHSPIHFFVSASPAVIIFFVLSGYVLSIQFFGNKSNNNYISYFIKRITRLYIPTITAILLSILLCGLLYEKKICAGFDTWVKTIWTKEITDIDWLKIFTLNTDEIIKFVPSSWTLPIELKISLLVPFMVAIIKKLSTILTLLVIPLFILMCSILNFFGAKDHLQEFYLTYYVTFFIMGIITRKYIHEILNRINSLPNYMYFLILLMASLIYTIDYNMWIFSGSVLELMHKLTQYFLAVAAVLFILFSLSDKAKSLMNHKVLIFFGNISFSLYLLHQVALVTTISLLKPFNIDYPLLMLIAGCFSLLLSYGFYVLCEKPSLKLAHSFSNAIGSFHKRNKVNAVS